MKNYLKAQGQSRRIPPGKMKPRIKFAKQRLLVGFDESELWNLDHTMIHLLYERLCAYRDIVSKKVDLNYQTFEIDGETLTQLEVIDKMINLIEEGYKNDPEHMLSLPRFDEVWKLWYIVHQSMWW